MNRIPQRILFATIATLEAATRATLGLDIHTQRDTSGMGWLAFAHTEHGAGNHEVWGLGLHVVVSRIRQPDQAA